MKRVIACLLAFVLLSNTMPRAPAQESSASSTVEIAGYFIAVDEWIPDPIDDDTMPVSINGQIYLPEGLFTHNSSPLKISFSRSDNNTVTLFQRGKMLIFDINAGKARDQSGDVYEYKAVVQNGRAYFPARKVCSFFDLEFDYKLTQFADFPLIRLLTANAIIGKEPFVSIAASSFTDRRNKILQSRADAAEPSEEPVVLPPEEQPEDETSQEIKRVYLAVQGASGLSELLDVFARNGQHGLFLLSPADILLEEDAVRRLVAQGHGIGIDLRGESAETAPQAFARANESLTHIARTRTSIILAEASAAAPLLENGCVLWHTTTTLRPSSSTTQVKSSIDERDGTTYLTVEASVQSAVLLHQLFTQLSNPEHYRLRMPTVVTLN